MLEMDKLALHEQLALELNQLEWRLRKFTIETREALLCLEEITAAIEQVPEAHYKAYLYLTSLYYLVGFIRSNLTEQSGKYMPVANHAIRTANINTLILLLTIRIREGLVLYYPTDCYRLHKNDDANQSIPNYIANNLEEIYLGYRIMWIVSRYNHVPKLANFYKQKIEEFFKPRHTNWYWSNINWGWLNNEVALEFENFHEPDSDLYFVDLDRNAITICLENHAKHHDFDSLGYFTFYELAIYAFKKTDKEQLIALSEEFECRENIIDTLIENLEQDNQYLQLLELCHSFYQGPYNINHVGTLLKSVQDKPEEAENFIKALSIFEDKLVRLSESCVEKVVPLTSSEPDMIRDDVDSVGSLSSNELNDLAEWELCEIENGQIDDTDETDPSFINSLILDLYRLEWKLRLEEVDIHTALLELEQLSKDFEKITDDTRKTYFYLQALFYLTELIRPQIHHRLGIYQAMPIAEIRLANTNTLFILLIIRMREGLLYEFPEGASYEIRKLNSNSNENAVANRKELYTQYYLMQAVSEYTGNHELATYYLARASQLYSIKNTAGNELNAQQTTKEFSQISNLQQEVAIKTLNECYTNYLANHEIEYLPYFFNKITTFPDNPNMDIVSNIMIKINNLSDLFEAAGKLIAALREPDKLINLSQTCLIAAEHMPQLAKDHPLAASLKESLLPAAYAKIEKTIGYATRILAKLQPPNMLVAFATHAGFMVKNVANSSLPANDDTQVQTWRPWV
jgi:hypothetical protein